MTDYNTTAYISRDAMIHMLSEDPEQFVYVLTGVLDQITADDVIDCAEIAPNVDKQLVLHNMAVLSNGLNLLIIQQND